MHRKNTNTLKSEILSFLLDQFSGAKPGQFGDEPKRVVFKATANALLMDRLLREDPTIESAPVTPHKVRIIAETVAKTDKIDARFWPA